MPPPARFANLSDRECHSQLLNWRNEAGSRLYDRLCLADELLGRKSWVEDPVGGGGSAHSALTRLEDDCFGDTLDPAFQMTQALELLHNVPDPKAWAKNKFNLRRMWADWKASQKPKKAQERTATARRHEIVPPASFHGLPDKQKDKEYDRAVSYLETKDQKIERLEAERDQWKGRALAAEAELATFKKKAKELLHVA